MGSGGSARAPGTSMHRLWQAPETPTAIARNPDCERVSVTQTASARSLAYEQVLEALYIEHFGILKISFHFWEYLFAKPYESACSIAQFLRKRKKIRRLAHCARVDVPKSGTNFFPQRATMRNIPQERPSLVQSMKSSRHSSDSFRCRAADLGAIRNPSSRAR